MILDCGHPPSEHGEHTTGYGITLQGKRYCWECCAELERADMRFTGKAILYLGIEKKSVGNWPNTLAFPIHGLKKGRHNIAGARYDFWFEFEDKHWHGVSYGDNTQIAHCKQIK